MNLGGYVVTYMISDAKWDALPKGVRTASLEAGDYAVKEGCAAADRLNQEDHDNIAAAGVKMVKLSAEDQKVLDADLSTIGASWASDLDARGLPGTAVRDAFQQAVDSY